MAFLDIQFPPSISAGALGGPGYSTDVAALSSGHESRNQNWSVGRGAWDVSHGVKTQTELEELIAFFRIAKGRANGFRFKDWSDYQVTVANGVLSALSGNRYQLQKRYTNSGGTEDRDITRPVSGTVVITGRTLGTEYTIDHTTGIITMVGSPPLSVTTWSGKFDVPARFDVDKMNISLDDAGEAEILFSSWSAIPVVELRI